MSLAPRAPQDGADLIPYNMWSHSVLASLYISTSICIRRYTHIYPWPPPDGTDLIPHNTLMTTITYNTHDMK